jgi:hypothetical protein
MIHLSKCKKCLNEVAKTYEPNIEGNFVVNDRTYSPDGREYGHKVDCLHYQKFPPDEVEAAPEEKKEIPF